MKISQNIGNEILIIFQHNYDLHKQLLRQTGSPMVQTVTLNVIFFDELQL